MDADRFTDIFQSADQQRIKEFVLVLESQSIESRVRFDGYQWILSVGPLSVEAAARELRAYSAEARIPRATPVAASAGGRPWPGIAAYIAVIVGIALLAPEMRFGLDWLTAGRMDSARLLAGDWWRAVTALTLHADAPHLLGNAVFGSFFGYSVARYLGGGFGWLAIVACGALGNFANAFLSGPAHRSIGASTAVFAALGLLSTFLWQRGFPAGATRRERLAPVVAGLGLLAFTGTGGVNTDLGAHLAGFVAGFAGGLVVARFGYPSGSRAQLACGLGALALVVLAWINALV